MTFLNLSTLMFWTFIGFVLLLTVLLIRANSKRTEDNPAGVKGDLIWVDEGAHVKPFFNHQFEVLGKPDAMYRTASGVTAVEYKSRMSGVLPSDIAQAKCAALSARANGYGVNEVVVVTGSGRVRVKLPKSDSDLFKEINPLVQTIRQLKRGKPGLAKPNSGKCMHCAYRLSCSSRAA